MSSSKGACQGEEGRTPLCRFEQGRVRRSREFWSAAQLAVEGFKRWIVASSGDGGVGCAVTGDCIVAED
jgi:hypothetical protein